MKKFQKRKENFVCEHCGEHVRGDGYTNHCPRCLYSKHVDVHPGDRAAECGGIMKVTELELEGHEYIFVHTCKRCGHSKRNRQAPQDSLEEIFRYLPQEAPFLFTVIFLLAAILLGSAAPSTSAAAPFSQPPLQKTAMSTAKEVLLIIYDETRTSLHTFEAYQQARAKQYDVRFASRGEIEAWCETTEVCDTTALPIWGGSKPLEYDGLKNRDDDIPPVPTRAQLSFYCGDCKSSWPSKLKSFLYYQDQAAFQKRLGYVMIAGEPDLLPYIPVWDEVPSVLYYQDLYEDSVTRNRFHSWDKNNNGILAEVLGQNHRTLCRQLSETCDDTNIEYYKPEIKLGIVPISDDQTLFQILQDSIDAETRYPERAQTGYFLASQAFFRYDTWFPTYQAKQIWKETGRNAVGIYAPQEGENFNRKIFKSVQPDCFFPEEFFSCWKGEVRTGV